MSHRPRGVSSDRTGDRSKQKEKIEKPSFFKAVASSTKKSSDHAADRSKQRKQSDRKPNTPAVIIEKSQIKKEPSSQSIGDAVKKPLQEQEYFHGILPNIKQNQKVKISDFGMSRFEDAYQTILKGKRIPIKWTALEAIRFGTYTTKSDVWSFGILIWEILHDGIMPYPNMSNEETIRFLDREERLQSPGGTPSQLNDVMQSCWRLKQIERPDFTMILSKLTSSAKNY